MGEYGRMEGSGESRRYWWLEVQTGWEVSMGLPPLRVMPASAVYCVSVCRIASCTHNTSGGWR